MDDVETVTIPKKEYDELQADSWWLAALESAGVDNWQGYEQALEILDEWKTEGDE